MAQCPKMKHKRMRPGKQHRGGAKDEDDTEGQTQCEKGNRRGGRKTYESQIVSPSGDMKRGDGTLRC